MSGTTVGALRDGIAANLAGIDGITVYPRPQMNMATPCATIVRTGTSWHEAAQGTVLWTFRVTVYVALTSDKAAQEKLDRFVDPDGAHSIKAAIEADETLGGVAEDTTVTEAGTDEVYERSAGTVTAQYVGTEFTVEVYAPAE